MSSGPLGPDMRNPYRILFLLLFSPPLYIYENMVQCLDVINDIKLPETNRPQYLVTFRSLSGREILKHDEKCLKTHTYTFRLYLFEASKYCHLCYQRYSAVPGEPPLSRAANDKINSWTGQAGIDCAFVRLKRDRGTCSREAIRKW